MLDVSDLIGVPYKTNGRDLKNGLDCYGLAIEIERRLGKKLNDIFYDNSLNNSLSSISSSLNLRPTDYLREGTILEIKSPLHIGVALNKKEFIHATSNGVRISLIANFKIEGFYEIWEH